MSQDKLMPTAIREPQMTSNPSFRAQFHPLPAARHLWEIYAELEHEALANPLLRLDPVHTGKRHSAHREWLLSRTEG
jgi:hypothetical protein